MGVPTWSPPDDALLAYLLGEKLSYPTISARMCRTIASIKARKARLKLAYGGALKCGPRPKRRDYVTKPSADENGDSDGGYRIEIIQQDDAFRRHMLFCIATGLERCPIGVVTEPSTQNPKFVMTRLNVRSGCSSSAGWVSEYARRVG